MSFRLRIRATGMTIIFFSDTGLQREEIIKHCYDPIFINCSIAVFSSVNPDVRILSPCICSD